MSDDSITTALEKMGLSIGQKVHHNSSGSGVVVGLCKGGYALIHQPDRKDIPCLKYIEEIHSTFKYVFDSKKIFSANRDTLTVDKEELSQSDKDDLSIAGNLGAVGFKVGDRVSIAGVKDKGTIIGWSWLNKPLLLMDENKYSSIMGTKSKLHSRAVLPKDGRRYKSWPADELIKIEEEPSTKDADIEEKLAKLDLKIGEKVNVLMDGLGYPLSLNQQTDKTVIGTVVGVHVAGMAVIAYPGPISGGPISLTHPSFRIHSSINKEAFTNAIGMSDEQFEKIGVSKEIMEPTKQPEVKKLTIAEIDAKIEEAINKRGYGLNEYIQIGACYYRVIGFDHERNQLVLAHPYGTGIDLYISDNSFHSSGIRENNGITRTSSTAKHITNREGKDAFIEAKIKQLGYSIGEKVRVGVDNNNEIDLNDYSTCKKYTIAKIVGIHESTGKPVISIPQIVGKGWEVVPVNCSLHSSSNIGKDADKGYHIYDLKAIEKIDTIKDIKEKPIGFGSEMAEMQNGKPVSIGRVVGYDKKTNRPYLNSFLTLFQSKNKFGLKEGDKIKLGGSDALITRIDNDGKAHWRWNKEGSLESPFNSDAALNSINGVPYGSSFKMGDTITYTEGHDASLHSAIVGSSSGATIITNSGKEISKFDIISRNGITYWDLLDIKVGDVLTFKASQNSLTSQWTVDRMNGNMPFQLSGQITAYPNRIIAINDKPTIYAARYKEEVKTPTRTPGSLLVGERIEFVNNIFATVISYVGGLPLIKYDKITQGEQQELSETTDFVADMDNIRAINGKIVNLAPFLKQKVVANLIAAGMQIGLHITKEGKPIQYQKRPEGDIQEVPKMKFGFAVGDIIESLKTNKKVLYKIVGQNIDGFPIVEGVNTTLKPGTFLSSANYVSAINYVPTTYGITMEKRKKELKTLPSYNYDLKLNDYIQFDQELFKGLYGKVIGADEKNNPIIEYITSPTGYVLPDDSSKVIDENFDRSHITEINEEPYIWIEYTEKVKSKLAHELTAAGYRIAAEKTITLSKNAIISILQKTGRDNEYIQSIEKLLDTEFGRSLIALSLGAGMTYMANDEGKLSKFAKECRIQSLTTLGNSIMDTVVSSALDAMKNEPKEKLIDESFLPGFLSEDYQVPEETKPKTQQL